MKKIVSLVLVFVMMLSFACVVHGERYDDIFNNPALEIVAEYSETGTPGADAKVISKWINSVYGENGVHFNEVSLYSDGVRTERTMEGFDSDLLEYATGRFPAYVQGKTEGKYVATYLVETEDGTEYYDDMYLIDTTGGAFAKTPLYSVLLNYDREKHETIFTVYSLKEENGKLVRTPLYDGPLGEEAYETLQYGTSYNDGLKFSKLQGEEYDMVYGYTDVNGRVYLEDYGMGYMSHFYNLGHMVVVTNNGDTLDYEQEDYEKNRVYTSTITDIFTGESYCFKDVDIFEITDTGYVQLMVTDAARNQTRYLAKLKKPAAISVHVNENKVRFDVLPAIKEGRTLVPLRAIFEALGAEISWDGATSTVTAQKGELNISLTVGSNKMTVGNEVKTLDVPAQIVDGRTLVPVRAISEAFGCRVEWDAETRAVKITE